MYAKIWTINKIRKQMDSNYSLHIVILNPIQNTTSSYSKYIKLNIFKFIPLAKSKSFLPNSCVSDDHFYI